MAVNKKEIGRRIKKIRVIDLDMNQDEFAGKAAITQSTVSRYEKYVIGRIPGVYLMAKEKVSSIISQGESFTMEQKNRCLD